MIKILKRIFQISKVVVYGVTKNEINEIQPTIPCKAIIITHENSHRVLEMRDKNVLPAFNNMLRTQQKGLFAEFEGKIVSHAWIQVHSEDQNNYNESIGFLKKNEAVIHFCNTQSMYRGQKIYPYLIFQLARGYFEENIEGVLYITTDVENIKSQNGLLKVGFHVKNKRMLLKVAKILKFKIDYENV